MYEQFGITENIENLANEAEKNIENVFKKIEEVEAYNSVKVMNAFQKYILIVQLDMDMET